MASYVVGQDVVFAEAVVEAVVVVVHCAGEAAGAVVQSFDDRHMKTANTVSLGRMHHWMQYSSQCSLTLQRHCKEKKKHY